MPTPPATIGRYQVIERLGGGAMGMVYRGFDPEIHRVVAIKQMRSELDSPDARTRFVREARAAGALLHPNIVSVFDFGEQDGEPYLIMEYVEGRTLQTQIANSRSVPLAARLMLLEQLCAGLAYAHARGVIHRDIKPANLMVDGNGTLKICDFGVARLSTSASLTSAIVGTLNYMSPEQWAGGPVDHRTDVFAVGVVAYELLTGRRAFSATTIPEIYSQMIAGEPLRLNPISDEIPTPLADIVHRLVERDPDRRYQKLDLAREDIKAARKVIARSDDTMTSIAADAPPMAAVLEPRPIPIPAPAVPSVQTEPTEDVPATVPSYRQEPVQSAAPGQPTARRLSRWYVGALAAGLLVTTAAGIRMATGSWRTTDGRTPVSSADAATIPPGVKRPAAGDPSAAAPVRTTPSVASTAPARPPITPNTDHATKAAHVVPAVTPDPVKREARNPGAATAAMERECASGKANACSELARRFKSGEGVAADAARAVAFSERACGAGAADDCATAAVAYRDGAAVGRDRTRAADLFQRACGAGRLESCSTAGLMYLRGDGIDKDSARGLTLLTGGCDGGDGASCSNLGNAFEMGQNVAKNVERATSLYHRACGLGFMHGCALEGWMYFRGVGAPLDPRHAVALFERSCDAHAPAGCDNLGVAYAQGRGVDQDPSRAAGLFKRACDGGNGPGCVNLGVSALNGKVGPPDPVGAALYFQHACNLDFANGCFQLGVSYANARGVQRDDAKATSLFQRACLGGSAPGCFNAGQRYNNGNGVAKDETEAARWFDRACTAGYADGCTTLALMYEQGRGVTANHAHATALLTRGSELLRQSTQDGSTGNGSASDGGASAPVRVGDTIPAPAKIKDAPPLYPIAARTGRIEGTVVLDAVIEPDGRVSQTTVIKSIPLLDDAAEQAVKRWVYAPTLREGRPVRVVLTVAVTFHLPS